MPVGLALSADQMITRLGRSVEIPPRSPLFISVWPFRRSGLSPSSRTAISQCEMHGDAPRRARKVRSYSRRVLITRRRKEKGELSKPFFPVVLLWPRERCTVGKQLQPACAEPERGPGRVRLERFCRLAPLMQARRVPTLQKLTVLR